MIDRLATATGFVLATLIGISSLSAEEKRQLDAHEHGHGTLNVAIVGTTLEMELEVPGADIVGFESEARSAAQKKILASAIKDLRAPSNLFQLPTAAGCQLKKASVEIEGDSHEEEHGHEKHAKKEHDHGKDEHAHEKKEHGHNEHGKDSAHKEDKEEGHNEFHVTYQFACSKPSSLTNVQFPYFKRFKNAEELEVNITTEKGQTKFEVSREKSQISLSGMI